LKDFNPIFRLHTNAWQNEPRFKRDEKFGLRGYFVTKFHIFVIRAVLGVVFAVLMTRFFYGKVDIIYVVGLAIFLVGMAYVLEYFRKRKSR
jgi:uncharacterized membrane protein HdeD (DUF308 family)